MSTESAPVILMRLCETAGKCKVGKNAFAYDFPDAGAVLPQIVFAEPSRGKVSQILDGTVSVKEHNVLIMVKGADNASAREMLESVYAFLLTVKNFKPSARKGVVGCNPITPIFPAGEDKNQYPVVDCIWSVMLE